jgi:hypothetical protein
MNETLYQQVTLKKEGLVDTVWIPQKFAVKDSFIKRKVNGIWSDGWKVETVYSGTLTESAIIQARDRHKYHREGTDI